MAVFHAEPMLDELRSDPRYADLLCQSIERNFSAIPHFIRDPFPDTLRKESEYAKLMEKAEAVTKNSNAPSSKDR